MSYTVFAGQDVGRKFYDNSYQHFGHANVFTTDRQSYRAPARPIHYGGARQPVSIKWSRILTFSMKLGYLELNKLH